MPTFLLRVSPDLRATPSLWWLVWHLITNVLAKHFHPAWCYFPHLLWQRGPQLRAVRPLSQSHSGYSGAAWTLQPSLQTLSQCLSPAPGCLLCHHIAQSRSFHVLMGLPFQIFVSFHPRHYKLLEGDHIASCKIQQTYIELLLFVRYCVKW